MIGCSFAAAATPDLDREIILAPHSSSSTQDREIVRWQERARLLETDAVAIERLAWAYVAKARETLDAGYYKLAEKTADVLETKTSRGAEVDLIRGHVLHNLHRFREAEEVARRLTAKRGLPVDLALLSDVLLELGKLKEAVEVLQQLVNLKPGLEAYTRIAYVRWLKGDVKGAAIAMADAERAAGPQEEEARTWTIVRLSTFALQQGEYARALAFSESALARMNDYPPALLAKGRALVVLQRPLEAIAVLERAAQLNPQPEYQWYLADVLRAAGRNDAAIKWETQIKTLGEATDARTYALFLATRGENVTVAQRIAQAELANRGDVLTHDALAWAAFAAGNITLAESEIRAALEVGTKDARLLWHAGEIRRAQGDESGAMEFFSRAAPLAGTLMPSERTRLETARQRVAAHP